MGRLSDLPLSIIEAILCLIPIQEAGRTSILSREWRYRWTKIPKLVFEDKTFQVSTVDGGAESSNEMQKMDRKSKLIDALGQVLLMHDGPIHEFTLSLRRQSSYIFSFHELTDPCLIGCFDQQPNFYKFGGLTSLILREVSISASTLQQILSNSPLLKTLFMDIPLSYITRSNDGGFTFTELFELFECLPVIETLSLSFDLMNVFEDYIDARVPRELPTHLFHLKYLYVYRVCFTRREEFILAFLIKNSPNLEKLKILDAAASMGSSSSVAFYQGIMLEHLNELEIKDFVFHDHVTRFDFVKLILARSPVLKTVRIFPHCNYGDKKLQISEILLRYSRASPEVQIIVEDPCTAARKMPL